MKEDFWLARWNENQIGFHQEKINSRLVKYWPTLQQKKDSQVFVPLCGKSLDLLWLIKQGHQVLGIELSEDACRDFFTENDLAFEVSQKGSFKIFKGENIELWQGDFFNLKPEHLANTASIYDRAAIIALPEEMRSAYVTHLTKIVSVNTTILFISMEYDQSKMNGPPFSVTEEEINNLFDYHFTVEKITESSGPEIVGNLKSRGLDTLTEKVYLIKRQ